MTYEELYEEILAKNPVDRNFGFFPGENTEFKYKTFSPFFENLYENKMIYDEGGVGWLIQVKDLEITPERFRATACPLCVIYNGHRLVNKELEEWKFHATWDCLMFGDDGISFDAYGGFIIWLDEKLIKRVEKLIAENRLDETRSVVWERGAKLWQEMLKEKKQEISTE